MRIRLVSGFLALLCALPCAGQVQAVMDKARAALASRDYAEAAARLREAAAMTENMAGMDALRGEIQYNLAVCHEKMGDRTGALAVARQRLASNPDDGVMLELAAKLEYVLGNYGEARAAFMRLKQRGPATPLLLRQIAQVEIARKSQADALGAVAELLAADASAPSLEVALDAYTTFSQDEQTLRAAAALRSLKGDHPLYRYAAGVAHARLGHHADAERELTPLLDDPLYGDEARLQAGTILAAQPDRAAEAVAMFAALLERDPYFSQAYYQLSRLLFRQKRADEAKTLQELYERLQASEQEFRRDRQFTAAGLSVDAAIHRARGYERTRQYAKAEAVLREMLRERPGDETLTQALARLLAQTERYGQAAELAGVLTSPAAYELVGVSLRAQGRIKDAVAHFTEHQEALQDAAWRHLGAIYLDDLGDPARARECLSKVAHDDAMVALDRARAELACGAVDAAEKLLAELARGENEVKDAANLGLAACAVRKGDAAAASALLDAVRGPSRGSGRYFTIKADVVESLKDERAPQYRAMRDRILALEEAARTLKREAAPLAWPQAAAKLVALSRNAEERRQRQEAASYALLAVEADPRSGEALRALLVYPLPDFVRLSVLIKLAALEPEDKATSAEIAGIRQRYGLAPGK